MRIDPGGEGVDLVAENGLEAAALGRWSGRAARATLRRSLDGTRLHIAFEDGPKAAETTATWMPRFGDWVRLPGSTERGRVVGFDEILGVPHAFVRDADGGSFGWHRSDELTPEKPPSATA